MGPFLAFQEGWEGIEKVSAEEFDVSPESSGPDAASALITSLLRTRVHSNSHTLIFNA
jgi:hypothetical protein